MKTTPLTRRTPLRSKSPRVLTPGKVAKPKIKRKPTVKTLKNKLWNLCRSIAAELYPPDCYTCDQTGLTGWNRQLGHFIPSSVCGAFLRYDVFRNLRWQCAACNQFRGGMGAVYYKHLVEDLGLEAVERVFEDRNVLVKADRFFYEDMIQRYSQILFSLQEANEALSPDNT